MMWDEVGVKITGAELRMIHHKQAEWDKGPARETGMTAYELMLSESQERMLVVVQKGHEEDVQEIFERWDLHAEIIGEVTRSGLLDVWHKGQKVASIPADSLVLGGGAPVYIRESREPEYLKETRAFNQNSLNKPDNLGSVWLKLLASPNIASKHWIYEQYDSMVRTNNVVLAQADAAVVYVKEADKALSLKTDCNGRYVYLNPRRGAMIAVAESARNVVCTGATPVAITNCLNFGNPYKPEIYWQFREAVAGIGEACRVLNTPVTGGNVSFYNESANTAVYPTPVIGMLGVIDEVQHVTTSTFKNAGDRIVLLGSAHGHVGGSEYLASWHGLVSGNAPDIDLDVEKKLHTTCLEAIRNGFVQSAHDCSEGGLAVALAECSILDRRYPLGASVNLPADIRLDFLIFGEDQSRIILSVPQSAVPKVLDIAQKHGVPSSEIGIVGGDSVSINGVEIGVSDGMAAYYNGVESRIAEKM